MPILTKFPGGGGGVDYAYPLGDAVSPDVHFDANGTVSLQWGDPEDGAAEWKGTIIVAKLESAPTSIEDGIKVADITERDKFKNAPLTTTVGGAGYYYGIFPYTKDYVVNNRRANVLYCQSSPEYMSWAAINTAVAAGNAARYWHVGDEKTIQLTGNYNVKLTLQVAGFNHDTLVNGGKAGVTFVTKEAFGSEIMADDYTDGGANSKWETCYGRTTIVPKIKASLPSDLQAVIKKVYKPSALGSRRVDVTGSVMNVEDDVFFLSQTELGYARKIAITGGGYNYCYEGTRYALYPELPELTTGPGCCDAIKKYDTAGNGAEYWLRSPADDNSTNYFMRVRSPEVLDTKYNYPIFRLEPVKQRIALAFGFCI